MMVTGHSNKAEKGLLFEELRTASARLALSAAVTLTQIPAVKAEPSVPAIGSTTNTANTSAQCDDASLKQSLVAKVNNLVNANIIKITNPIQYKTVSIPSLVPGMGSLDRIKGTCEQYHDSMTSRLNFSKHGDEIMVTGTVSFFSGATKLYSDVVRIMLIDMNRTYGTDGSNIFLKAESDQIDTKRVIVLKREGDDPLKPQKSQ